MHTHHSLFWTVLLRKTLYRFNGEMIVDFRMKKKRTETKNAPSIHNTHTSKLVDTCWLKQYIAKICKIIKTRNKIIFSFFSYCNDGSHRTKIRPKCEIPIFLWLFNFRLNFRCACATLHLCNSQANIYRFFKSLWHSSINLWLLS